MKHKIFFFFKLDILLFVNIDIYFYVLNLLFTLKIIQIRMYLNSKI
jgi:hypothetical protein